MFDLFIANAIAQDAPAAPQGAGFMQFLPLIVIGVIFYFLIIRPQKKRMQQEQSFISSLEKGIEVYTKSGMIGTITGITDKLVTLEVADGVKVKFLRSQIGGKADVLFAPPKEEKK